MKKIIGFLLACTLIFATGQQVFAQDNEVENQGVVIEVTEDESEEVSEELPTNQISPRTLYIMNIETTLTKINGNLRMKAIVYCTQEMAEIKTYFHLQQSTPDGWVTVASTSTSVYDENLSDKSATATGAPAGVYRLKAVAKVTDYNGFTESAECCTSAYVYSGA